LASLNALLAQLETDAKSCKDTHQKLVEEKHDLEHETKICNDKFTRASSLFQNLNEEKTRWEKDSSVFETQIKTVIGDALYSAGFMTYIGFYDRLFRDKLLASWKEIIISNNISVNEDHSFIEYLSKPKERGTWI
jgi:hypothetical protein